MTLKEAFNGYSFSRENDTVLAVSNGKASYYYDFGQRLMTTWVYHGGGSTPFAQLDREVLVAMRDKLVELGGHPPELPEEKPSNPGNNRKLSP